MLTFLVTIWSIPIIHYRRKNHPLFKFRLAVFFWAFKSNLASQLFTPFFLTRRFVHLLFIAIFQAQSFVPNAIQMLLGITFLGYIAVVRPFKSGVATLTAFLMELLVIIMQLNLLPFYTKLASARKERSKEIIKRLIPFFLLTIIIIMGVMIWWRAMDFFYMRRFGKKRNTFIHRWEYRYHKWLYPKRFAVKRDKTLVMGNVPTQDLSMVTEEKDKLKVDKNLEALMNESNKSFKTNVKTELSFKGDLKDGQFDVNKVRKDNKDDERFDDKILYREKDFAKGFPEREANNKYIVKRTGLKEQAPLNIHGIGDVTYKSTERTKKREPNKAEQAPGEDPQEDENPVKPPE